MQVRRQDAGCGIRGSGLRDTGLLWDAVVNSVHSVVMDTVVAHGDRVSHVEPVGGGTQAIKALELPGSCATPISKPSPGGS